MLIEVDKHKINVGDTSLFFLKQFVMMAGGIRMVVVVIMVACGSGNDSGDVW